MGRTITLLAVALGIAARLADGPGRLVRRKAGAVLGALGRYDEARSLIQTLPFEDACRAYRTSPVPLREALCSYTFMASSRFIQMSQPELVDLIGPPDAIWWDTGRSILVYTGAGRVSDGMAGFLFHFDAAGRVACVIGAN